MNINISNTNKNSLNSAKQDKSTASQSDLNLGDFARLVEQAKNKLDSAAVQPQDDREMLNSPEYLRGQIARFEEKAVTEDEKTYINMMEYFLENM